MSYFANFTEILTNEKSELMICRLFIGQKFRKKFTPTPALYPSSKNTDSDNTAAASIGRPYSNGRKRFMYTKGIIVAGTGEKTVLRVFW